MSGDAVFFDTNGWIALLNADDHFHAQAAKHLRDFEAARRPLITTDWVLAETGNGLARVPPRTKFVLAVETFLASPNSRLVRVDAALAYGLSRKSTCGGQKRVMSDRSLPSGKASFRSNGSYLTASSTWTSLTETIRAGVMAIRT